MLYAAELRDIKPSSYGTQSLLFMSLFKSIPNLQFFNRFDIYDESKKVPVMEYCKFYTVNN